MVKRGLLAASAVLLATWGQGAIAAPPPASAFGRIPAVVDAAISPNGQHVAILGGAAGQRVVSVATIDQPGLPILQLGDVETNGLSWASDDYVIANIAIWNHPGPNVSYRLERHIAISPEAKAVSRFFDNVQASAYLVGGQPIIGFTSNGRALVSDLSDGGGALGTQDTRIKRKGAGNPAVSALWSIDLATGKGRLVERGGPETGRWEADLSGEPRVKIDYDSDGHRMSIYGRGKGKATWSLLWTLSEDDPIKFYGYSEPEDAVYFFDGAKVQRRALADGTVSPVSETGPSPRLLWDLRRNQVIGIASGGEKPVVEWKDTEIAAAHGVLTRAFKGKVVTLESWSDDRTRLMARVSGPTAPGAWYLYDRVRKEVSPLGEEYPELKGAELGTTRYFTYKARDGLEIPAYVTMPPGAAAGAKLPLVVLPHGGPASRDDFEFDWLAQFLATRGYVVLQPQFRGSSGFGQAFRDAGRGEWGGKMQTDLLDGVAALAAAGDVNSARVCIVGASFGGYSALAGATLHPDAYRCAASIAGVSDLGVLLNDELRLYGPESGPVDGLREELAVADGAKLALVSPAQHAADAKAPILLIHGDQDTVVLPSQSRLMAERLKAAGKTYDYIVLEGENHYLTKAANRTRVLEALEAFLAKNLPVR